MNVNIPTSAETFELACFVREVREKSRFAPEKTIVTERWLRCPRCQAEAVCPEHGAGVTCVDCGLEMAVTGNALHLWAEE